jgi:hypothetical protein
MSQSGAFSTAQAHRLGVDDLESHRLVRDGAVLRYVVALSYGPARWTA